MTRLPYKEKHWWSSLTGADSMVSAWWQHSVAKREDVSGLSRVQRRLKRPLKSDRAFLKLVRRKRSQSSRLYQRANSERFRIQLLRGAVVSAFLGLSLGGNVLGSLFVNEKITLGGVPYRVVQQFWNDRQARDAYFGGDRQALHDRLADLEIEESIKRYYSSRFDSEDELDLYIHQVMFDRTGYVGEAYQVNNYGELSPVSYRDQDGNQG
ncbi:MAG: hypothetical protein AAFP03_03150 [Cyanobacteria bacterium J06598_3]